MIKLTIEIIDAPTSWVGMHGIRVVFQSRIRPDEHLDSPNNTWNIDIPVKDGKWTGSFVGRNSDGRRFMYFAWLDVNGRRFRRIKLYQDQAVGESVRIQGTMKDGSPACSTARILN